MYNNYRIPRNFGRYNYNNRLIGGGFLGPFLLGGITGGLAAPLFYGNNRPNNYYYYPYPVYPYSNYYYRPF